MAVKKEVDLFRDRLVKTIICTLSIAQCRHLLGKAKVQAAISDLPALRDLVRSLFQSQLISAEAIREIADRPPEISARSIAPFKKADPNLMVAYWERGDRAEAFMIFLFASVGDSWKRYAAKLEKVFPLLDKLESIDGFKPILKKLIGGAL